MSSNPHAPTILSSIIGTGQMAGPTGRIGPYRLLSVLGEGGFGIVYLAEQTEPVRRRIALKIIKLGMDTAQVVARFDAERQALALMDHPNVAKVLDAGSTEQGRPYFVMEYVPGEPLLAYCDKARLSTRERVELFVSVCEAVQHAHHKGIVHRDLKPSNVLVELVDGRATPKVIDFGISKAINQPLTQRTIFTEAGQMVGTPEYMSPEQAEMSGLNVDTRTDIYSLGVMLYEALTGSLPFESDHLRSVGLDEVHRLIREVDPPRPSARAHAQRDTVTFARLRRTEPASLTRQLRGDLDWITMRAMEKDRTRRYPSASEFAEDLRRYLRDEPVTASPPSAAYIVRKFVRRHRTLVGAGSIAGAALALGIGAIAYAAVASGRARDGMQRALESFEAAQEIFFAPIEQARPELARGREVSLRAFIDGARANLPARSADPLVLAAMQDALGTTYLALGVIEEAEALLKPALSAREAELGPRHPQTLASRHRWAALLDARGEGEEAASILAGVVSVRERILGPLHRDTLNSRDLLATVTHHRAMERPPGDERDRLLGESRELHLRTLDDRTRAFGRDDPDTLDSRNNLAAVLTSMGSILSAHDETLAVHASRAAAWGESHPKAITAEFNLGLSAWDLGDDRKWRPDDPRWSEAMDRVRSAANAYARVMGPTHDWTLEARGRLARMLADPGTSLRDPRLAAQTIEPVLTARRSFDPYSAAAIGDLCFAAALWAELGDPDRATRELDEARRHLPASDPGLSAIEGTLARISPGAGG